jgi:NAD(P)-dependent dehydrogenase (short-subunit alcohol dehydrogenase family)
MRSFLSSFQLNRDSAINDMVIENRVAVITGAASGIGRESGIRFAHEGAKIVIADKDADNGEQCAEEIRKNGGEARFFRTDVSSTSEVQELMNFTVETYGCIHILFNNAGIFLHQADGPATEVREDVFERHYQVNLRGTYLCCKYGIPHIIKSGGGSVINMATVDAIIGIGYDGYAASKGGVIALTRSMAVSFAPYKVRVNCIAPGTVMTNINKDELSDPKKAEKYMAMTPIGRFADPREIAAAALFLASEESSYIVGVVLVVDGGMSIV